MGYPHVFNVSTALLTFLFIHNENSLLYMDKPSRYILYLWVGHGLVVPVWLGYIQW